MFHLELSVLNLKQIRRNAKSKVRLNFGLKLKFDLVRI